KLQTFRMRSCCKNNDFSLFQKRRPGRVRGEIGSRDSLLVATGEIDRVELRPAGPCSLAEEHQHAAVRRPGRPLLLEAARQNALAGAVELHDADLEFAARLLGEGDEVAAW